MSDSWRRPAERHRLIPERHVSNSFKRASKLSLLAYASQVDANGQRKSGSLSNHWLDWQTPLLKSICSAITSFLA